MGTPRSNSATAIAHPNIALIKYWGVLDGAQNLPANGSISMTLDGLQADTTVTLSPSLQDDTFTLNGLSASEEQRRAVGAHLDRIRELAHLETRAEVKSTSNFPEAAGIASSASGFAALTLAGCAACGLELSSQDLSRLARKGSGSACRSVFGGYVEWLAGPTDAESYARQLHGPEHWPLIDWVAVVDRRPKAVSSRAGHALAMSSPLQAARVADAPRRLRACRQALAERDFDRLAAVVELDSNMMHSVMMTSSPPILYWAPATIQLMQQITQWRRQGLSVCYTIDAGPNVHCLTTAGDADEVGRLLEGQPDVTALLRAPVGGQPQVLA